MASISGSELERLLNAARQGDLEALGPLLETYKRYLELLAKLQLDRRLQVRMSASDVVQETFLHAAKGFPLFRGTTEGELMAWLRKILASRLANAAVHHGAAKRDMKLERQMDERLDQSSQMLARAHIADITSPSQQAVKRESAVLLADALADLPAHYREVIVLRHLEGYSFSDVAERMGKSVDSVKNIWARGLTRLRIQLGDSP